MNNFNRCNEILNSLNISMRYWNQDVNEFTDKLVNLSCNERALLSSKTSNRLKYGYMCQVLGEINREFDKYDDNRKKEILRQAYVLVIFENFDFDYRESLLRVRSFSNKTAKYSELKKDIWGEVSHLAQTNLIEYMGESF